MQKKCTLLLVLLISFSSLALRAQVTVAGANTGNGSYTTLSSAFTAINSGSQAGAVITVNITASPITEVSSAILNSGTWTSISIQPTGGASRVINSTYAPAIELNGADNVTINGLNSGGNSLTINNNNTAVSTAAIRFINDACNNLITNCTLMANCQSQNVAGQGAVVWFYTSPLGTVGNDNNTISNCNITSSGGTRPSQGIRSDGSSGKTNSNNTITNCNIYDFGTTVSATCSNGINIAEYSTTWTITDNKIYEPNTIAFATGTNFEWRGIYINVNGTPGAGGFTITGNTIGYSNSSGTGNTTITTGPNMVYGIAYNAPNTGGSASNISNNVIANIDQTSSRSPIGVSDIGTQVFTGIFIRNGLVTVSNNTIGSNGSSGSITIRGQQVSASATTCVAGIMSLGSASNTFSGNTIGGFTITSASGATNYTESFAGIRNENSGTTSFTSNSIGNSLSNNVTTDQNSAGLYGIYLGSSAGVTTLSSNTIQNLNHTGTLGTSSIVGIISQLSGTATYSASQNRIFNLACSNTSTSSTVYGMLLSGASSGAISQNQIYALSVSSPSPTGTISGIRTFSNYTLSNNIITLGSGLTNNPQIYGIEVLNGAPTMYYNSVVITGAASGSASATYSLSVSSSTASYNIQNNIFYNTRSSGNNAFNRAIHYSGAAQLANVTTENYNDLYIGSPNTALGSIGGITYANLAAWQTGSGKDANSISSSVTFVNIANDLHLTDCSMAGKAVAIGVTTDYDGSTRNTLPWIGADEPFVTWNGGVGNWNVASNWTPNGVPSSYQDVIISSGSVSLNADATCHSITIGTGVTLSANIYKLIVGGNSCINSFFVNNGSFNANTGTVEFVGANSVLSGYIGGTNGTTFNNVTLNTGITFPATPLQSTLNSSLQLNSGSYVNSNSPIYGSSSTLTYNTNGAYGVGLEWTSATDGVAGSGRPYNVTIVNSTVNMPAANRAMAGALTINLLGTLILNAGSGDLYIRGNWSDQGTFTPNNRAVFFTGLADQTITRVGGGIESFPYFCINKPNAGTYVKPDNTAGNLTDVSITGTAGNVLQLLNNGSLDLNGRTVTLEGNNIAATTGYIYVNWTRTITNSQGVNNGKFEIKSSSNPNQPAWFTKAVANNAGVGTLTFDQNVLVTIADGKMDFGLSAGVNLTTIQGVLQINLGGSVYPNSCYYSGSPASTLRFANTIDYQVSVTDKTWASGAIFSGLPGIPYNVEVNTSGTDLTINDTRALRNNLTITDGTFTLNAGPFNIGGNWSRTGATSSFNPNTNRVVFDGNVDQVINCIANSNTETYYQLENSNNDVTPELTLSGSTDVRVTNQLILTSGMITTNANEVWVTNNSSTSVSGYQTNPSLGSYISSSKVNGNLRRNMIATTGYDFPVGTSSNYQLASVYFNNISGITDAVMSFTSGSGGTFTGCQINGTDIIDMLNGGYWSLLPSGSTAGVSYDLTLNETGYTNFSGSPTTLGLIKRANSGLPWSGTNYGSDGTHSNLTQQMYAGPIATAVRSNIPSFSDYAIGFSSNIILPIEITTFTVTSNGNDALLNWNTSSEYNSDFFSIERSDDGSEFYEIGRIAAAGYSSLPLHYSFPDKNISTLGLSRVYYRIRAVDADQSFEYSQVESLNLFSSGSSIIKVFPNPFNNDFNISWTSVGELTGALQITDATGRIHLQKEFFIKKGLNTLQVNELSDLSTGVYFLSILSGSDAFSSKMVKE